MLAYCRVSNWAYALAKCQLASSESWTSLYAILRTTCRHRTETWGRRLHGELIVSLTWEQSSLLACWPLACQLQDFSNFPLKWGRPISPYTPTFGMISSLSTAWYSLWHTEHCLARNYFVYWITKSHVLPAWCVTLESHFHYFMKSRDWRKI